MIFEYFYHSIIYLKACTQFIFALNFFFYNRLTSLFNPLSYHFHKKMLLYTLYTFETVYFIISIYKYKIDLHCSFLHFFSIALHIHSEASNICSWKYAVSVIYSTLFNCMYMEFAVKWIKRRMRCFNSMASAHSDLNASLQNVFNDFILVLCWREPMPRFSKD